MLREWAQETHRRAGGLPVYYTEWNSSSNPRDALHDEPYAAAAIVKTMMEAIGLVEGYSYWTFTDIFAENYFPAEPFHGGFGLLNFQGIAKPAYRAFEFLHALGTELYTVDGKHDTVDSWVAGKPESATILLTNYALPRHPINTEVVEFRIAGCKPIQRVSIKRIDEHHGNPKRQWIEMGRTAPQFLQEVDRLEQGSVVVAEDLPWKDEAGGNSAAILDASSVSDGGYTRILTVVVTIQQLPSPHSAGSRRLSLECPCVRCWRGCAVVDPIRTRRNPVTGGIPVDDAHIHFHLDTWFERYADEVLRNGNERGITGRRLGVGQLHPVGNLDRIERLAVRRRCQHGRSTSKALANFPADREPPRACRFPGSRGYVHRRERASSVSGRRLGQ